MFKKIAVAMSGGVDSSIAAHLLKRKGYEVIGVYMKNWDLNDEQGACSLNQDLQDAQAVCNALKVSLVEVNFVKEYWNEVFLHFIEDYEHGFTPNPDILCNKFIKFSYFVKYAMEKLGCDAIATGHYANSSFGNFLEHYAPQKSARLLKARDYTKDQTFFLSQINQESLKRTMFPLGNLLKRDVKNLAIQIGLQDIAEKRESMGICFIGSRSFQKFICEYIADQPGYFIDIDSGKMVGKHNGIHQWTIGQRTHLGGFSKAYFVAKKCYNNNIIYVAAGTNHPMLYSSVFFTTIPHWLNSTTVLNTCFDCTFKFQHIHDISECRIMQSSQGIAVLIKGEKRALAPGQYAVFYNDNECLGSARIISTGPTKFSLNWLENNKCVNALQQSACPN